MSAGPTIVDRVRILLRDVLSVEVPTDNTDLMDSGLIDSLAIVTMIAEIETEFQVEFPLDDLDVEQFRSVQRLAEFVSKTVLAGDITFRALAIDQRPSRAPGPKPQATISPR